MLESIVTIIIIHHYCYEYHHYLVVILVQEIGQKVAMHAVAMKPRYLSPETVPAEALEGEAAHVTGIPQGLTHATKLLWQPRIPYHVLTGLNTCEGSHSMMHARDSSLGIFSMNWCLQLVCLPLRAGHLRLQRLPDQAMHLSVAWYFTCLNMQRKGRYVHRYLHGREALRHSQASVKPATVVIKTTGLSATARYLLGVS